MKERFFCERNDMVKNERIATELRKEDFYYDLPQAQIAQHPAEPRDAARLMVIDRASGEIAHRHFYDILDYIRPEDVLVVNDSKVIPAPPLRHGCREVRPRGGVSASAPSR